MEIRTLYYIVAFSLGLSLVTADFTANCPQECKCVWASGNKQADCSHSNFHDIPKTLSTEIQILDLTNNELYEITRHAFEDVRLINLKKLILKECKLITIHKNGLSGLAIMIELDLSKNDLKTLHAETFKETSKIRWILLNDNQIEKLENGLFNNLPFLQKVDLSNNHLVQIGVKTFMNVPKLNILRLDGNKLEHLKIDTLSALTSLSNLDVHDNPWKCDCYLQPFRNWVISKNFYTSPISCSEPAKVNGKLWKELDSSDFACRPSIIYPSTKTTLRSSDTNVTLSCQVDGNPLPEVNWVLNAQIIDGTYRYQGEIKYFVTQSNSENSKWVNLTIFDAGSSDNGEYLCVAKNAGGVEERSLTLAIAHAPPGIVAPPGMDNSMLPVLIGISCTAAILLIILVILCYYCCRRRGSEKKNDNVNGEALIEGSVIPEMEKSLITAVNPVTKPPRRYDAPLSISSATEMSELNKTLLDNDSVFAHNDDEKRSLDFDQHTKRSQDALNVEYGRTDGRAYPPDLLSFPARAAQISPAASNASTVPDTSRLQINPVSPIHSPIYGMTTNQNLFRTLPYSRSQSPFTAPITPPVVTPRQGYVTIPRRPRVPSWSSTASTQILPSAEAQEPLYDNLGLRTTADGSSVLSLNKAGLEQQFSPMRNRPLPATPTVYPNPHPPVYYAPIEEQEPAPSPVPPPFTPTRNSISSQISNQLSTPGPQEPVNQRMSWTAKNTSTPQTEPRKQLINTMDNRNADAQSQISDNSTLSRKGKPETGSLRRNPRSDKDEIGSPSREDPRKNESNVSLNQSGTMGRSGKIPPRPPPKPKKKPSTEVNPNEPLFEDEGEDGTEV
ncbi:uncharacterized protein LOC124537788 [Vanessa cardui]|uniref:uncharacterized protein LOC124537788 n=1 Tax=Vanessa cardui TaxID=171605 RepID=UPI001F145578|nr:uncharacterized protein LOC124537788 [Vanessa cardui]XP_046970646.1 uncharacterized protein LOC124537788 [Vanessa cardui]XP_046970647.1 uncharacterized protein LOC124537788 [Vanessa cardui]XP_046970648.1 uncharacterized protein LOC124537788 [Vanessa cardui]